jgi:hypothetical protein
MSLLQYNCVNLGNVLTESVTSEAVYDPVSGIDFLYNKITLSVKAYVSFVADTNGGIWWGAGASDSQLPPMLAGETPPQTMLRVQQALLEPRRPLSFYNGGKTLVTARDPNNPDWGAQFVGGVGDVNNGPRDNKCVITQLTNKAFLVNFQVTTYQNHCSPSLTLPYLSLRWTTSQLIDEKHYTTIKTVGTIVIDPRCPLGTNPDDYRNLFIPPRRNGFTRKGVNVTIQADGLAANFEITDVEHYLPPGAGAVRASGRHSIFSEGTNGAQIFQQYDVKLEGRKNDPKADMMLRAINIAIQGLIGAGAAIGTPISGSARESLWENEVEVSLKCRTMLPDRLGLQLQQELKRFAHAPLGSEPGTDGPDPGLRGTALRSLQAAVATDPCANYMFGSASCNLGGNAKGPIDDEGLGMPVDTPNDGLPEATVIVSTDPILPTSLGSLDPIPGYYESCVVTAEYTGDTGLIALPVSGGGTSGSLGIDLATGTGVGKTTAVAQLHSPQAQKTFSWSITKLGGRPARPQVASKDPNFVLLNRHDNLDEMNRLPDGNLSFTISGSATYAALDGTSPRLAFPIPPWLTLSDAETEALKATENVVADIFRDEKATAGWPA